MWLMVATDPDSVKSGIYTYIEGNHVKKYYFDDAVAADLDKDCFLQNMWSKFDALFDWGDCDFFPPEKCERLHEWVVERLKHDVPDSIKAVYLVIKKFSEIAVRYQTGIYFDF